MPNEFSFYESPRTPFDFSPLVEGGHAMGKAYAGIGESLGAGLIERARLQEKRREFDQAQAVKALLYDAQRKKQASDSRRQEIKDYDARQHQGVMEQQGAQRIALDDQRFQVQQGQFARTQGRLENAEQRMAMGERRRSDEAALKQIHEEAEKRSGLGLIEEMHRRGHIDDSTKMIASQIVENGDPVARRQELGRLVDEDKKRREVEEDDAIRKEAPKELLKDFDELLKAEKETGRKRTPEDVMSIRQRIRDIGDSFNSGESLKREITAARKLISPVSSGAKDEDKPKISLEGGQTVEDRWGLTKGGSFETMTREQRTALLSLGQQSAQKDRNWPTADKVLEVLYQTTEDPDPAAIKAAVESVPKMQQEMILRHGNRIAEMNGWKAGSEDSSGASRQSGDAAPVTIDSLTARAKAEGWTKEQFFEAARQAGIR